MSAKRKFTLDEIRILESNKYTLYATEDRIVHTKEFKETYWKMYNEGMPPRTIIKELGYDVDILGKKRASMYPSKLKEELDRNGEFRDRNSRSKLKPPTNTDYENMKDKKAMKEMQAELKYMRQELDFLKKLIELDNCKK